MKTLTLILLPILCASRLAADELLSLLGGSPPSTPTPTYIVKQTFEGTGYANSEAWNLSVGTVNSDYTGVVLAGSQSLLANLDDAAGRIRLDFTGADDLWGYFLFRREGGNPGGDRLLFEITNNGGTSQQFGIFVTTTGALRVFGGTSATTVSTTSVGTTYHIWWRYTKGTGSNAVAQVAFSTDGTEPTSGNAFASVTNGTSTTQGGRVWVGYSSTNAGADFIYDNVLIDDADISSNPPIP